MDNQHRAIKGYRDLTKEEIADMNQLKDLEEELGAVLAGLRVHLGENPAAQRWLSIARTHLEIGFMFALKSVAQPTNGIGRAL